MQLQIFLLEFSICAVANCCNETFEFRSSGEVDVGSCVEMNFVIYKISDRCLRTAYLETFCTCEFYSLCV